VLQNVPGLMRAAILAAQRSAENAPSRRASRIRMNEAPLAAAGRVALGLVLLQGQAHRAVRQNRC